MSELHLPVEDELLDAGVRLCGHLMIVDILGFQNAKTFPTDLHA